MSTAKFYLVITVAQTKEVESLPDVSEEERAIIETITSAGIDAKPIFRVRQQHVELLFEHSDDTETGPMLDILYKLYHEGKLLDFHFYSSKDDMEAMDT